jgi:uncharacterized OB-fold protein
LSSDNLRPWASYVEGIEADELRYQKCATCARAIFYPRMVCNWCGSSDISFRVSQGAGTVYSVTVVNDRETGAYCVVLVDLDEGFRMMSSVVNVAPETVAIGARVGVSFDVGDDGEKRVVFVPANEDS